MTLRNPRPQRASVHIPRVVGDGGTFFTTGRYPNPERANRRSQWSADRLESF
jgi:hypothetical protein